MTPETDNSSRPPGLQTLAWSVCQGLYENVISQEEMVRAGDAEAVHDMRVAVRRLRVALSNFAVCFEAERRRAMRAQLGQIADVLGAVRDLDVMLEALKQQKNRLTPEQKKYVGGLSRRLRARRRRRRRKLLAFLQGDEYAAFKRQFPLLMAARGQTAD
ncbi:MAG TPA: CHAD domain-containing protein [Blastocatellia bacterium]|nr:CHAD domain-containing protein [Blastocatellia bacterium]